jgi:hypothetical protein
MVNERCPICKFLVKTEYKYVQLSGKDEHKCLVKKFLCCHESAIFVTPKICSTNMGSFVWLATGTPYRSVVTIYTTSLTYNNSTFCVFMCFVWISEQTAIISLYSINRLGFITEI